MTRVEQERWRQVRELVEAALELGADERATFLANSCDDDLRAEVDSLLEAHAAAGPFLDRPAVDVQALLDDDADPPEEESIGPYRLLRTLGRGGMGTVYLATRDSGGDEDHGDADGELVALKVLKPGMDTRALLERFLSERRILAQLEHPSIAKLLDGGETPQGRPYLVMGYVDGVPIDAYCDDHRLAIDERLRLVLAVAAAVRFAHRNLVVHRDLKPANILVTAAGEVKLLDFGIAKLLRSEEFPRTVVLTATGQMPMTPEYASPEQVRGGVITTASDVYSLGVLLYELLTGHGPYALASRDARAITRAVCEDEPEKPSVAVGRRRFVERSRGFHVELSPEALADLRGVDPRRLRRRLEGDLDTIVLMALRKEPERRYASVEQLAEDLERHLAGLPVLARPDTFFYRARKFVSRHRVGVGAAVAAVAVPATFTLSLLRQRRRIERERNHAREVSRFLVDLFEIADPEQSRGETITAREVLRQGAREIRHRLNGQPALQAELMETIGRVHQSLGLYQEAGELLEDALARRLETRGEPAALARSLTAHGGLLVKRGDYEAAEEHLLRALGLLRRDRPEDDETRVRALASLAAAKQMRGDYGAAQTFLRQALGIARDLHGDDHPSVAVLLNDLGWLETCRGDYAAAEGLLRQALEIERAVYEGPHPALAGTLHNLGKLLHFRLGRLEDASRVFEEALAMRRAIYGDRHPDVAATLLELGRIRGSEGRFDLAEELLRDALGTKVALLGRRHPEVAVGHGYLAHVLLFQERYEEAESLLREALDVLETKADGDHFEKSSVLQVWALAHRDQGRHEAAVEVMDRALELARCKGGDDHPDVAFILVNLASTLHRLGDLERAESCLRQALRSADATIDSDHYARGVAFQALASVLVAQGRDAEAEAAARASLEVLARALGRDHPWSQLSRAILGSALAGQGRFTEAEELLRDSYERLRQDPGAKWTQTLTVLYRLVDLYESWKKPRQAAAYRARIPHDAEPFTVRRAG